MLFDTWYIYIHKCPISKEVIYVGMGETDRAWLFKANYRDKPHQKYLYYLRSIGYLPSDWVKIYSKFHSRKEARILEKQIIKKFDPKFNKHKGEGSFVSKEKVKEVTKLFKSGMSRRKISKKLGISYMSAWRYSHVY